MDKIVAEGITAGQSCRFPHFWKALLGFVRLVQNGHVYPEMSLLAAWLPFAPPSLAFRPRLAKAVLRRWTGTVLRVTAKPPLKLTAIAKLPSNRQNAASDGEERRLGVDPHRV
ncbi:MAG: hypothetical protein IJJ33_03045 [Victivallales bacterium]|nr:hypothetical protein [Victivallales bacterium]